MKGFDINEISFDPENVRIKENWQRLQAQIPGHGIALSYTWFQSCAQACLTHSINRRLLEIKDKTTDKIVALIPYTIQNGTYSKIFKVKALHLMRFHREHGDHYELLIHPNYYEQVVEQLGIWLSGKNIDVCFIDNLDHNSKFFRIIKGKPRHHFIMSKKENVICPYISLPTRQNFDIWRNGRFKSILRYKRRLEKMYKVSYCKVKDQEELNHILKQYKLMHTARFKNIGQDSSICSDPIQYSFVENLAKNSLENGTLRAYYIKLNDEIVSIELSFFQKNVMYAFTSAFNVKYAKYSIGSIQLLTVLENAIAENADVLDLLQGDEHYKFLWTNKTSFDHKLVLFPKNIYGYILHYVTVFRVPLGIIYRNLQTLKNRFQSLLIRPKPSL